MHVGFLRFLVALYVGTDYYMHIEHPKITTHKKIKAVPAHDIEAYMGSRGIAPLFINLGTKWK
jgi:hypothetical protein